MFEADVTPERVISSKQASFAGVVNQRNHTIDSKPWGLDGYQNLGFTRDYQGRTVYGLEEVTTDRATFVKVKFGDFEGWVDKRGIDIEEIKSQQFIKFAGKVKDRSHTIDTLPWGVEGFERLANTRQFVGRTVYGTEEAITDRGRFVKVRVGDLTGWVHDQAIEFEAIQKEEPLNLVGKILQRNHTIDTLPWGVQGYRTIGLTRDYHDLEVNVLAKATTQRTQFYKIKTDKFEGWVDVAGIQLLEQKQPIATHTVVPGDSLWAIATKNNVMIQNLIDWNNRKDNYVYSGEKLFVQNPALAPKPQTPAKPAKPSKPVATPTHTVVRGDSLWAIANKHGVTVQNLIDWNNRKDNYVYPGEKLFVQKPNNSKPVTPPVKPNPNVGSQSDRPVESKVVYIDAGHGGWETGAYYYGIAEKDMNLSITKRLSALLREQGYTVMETRTTDVHVPLTERQLEPNEVEADIYISVHHNTSGPSGKQQGIVTLFHDNSVAEWNYPTLHDASKLAQNRKLAQIVQSSMVEEARKLNPNTRDLGARPQNLHVTRTTNMPSILVELGFMDHWNEMQWLKRTDYQNNLINGIVKGVNRYFNNI
ncbi:N-acetylmuramoyl-L-alanine amidase [Dolosicoccus paucivorans]